MAEDPGNTEGWSGSVGSFFNLSLTAWHSQMKAAYKNKINNKIENFLEDMVCRSNFVYDLLQKELSLLVLDANYRAGWTLLVGPAVYSKTSEVLLYAGDLALPLIFWPEQELLSPASLAYLKDRKNKPPTSLSPEPYIPVEPILVTAGQFLIKSQLQKNGSWLVPGGVRGELSCTIEQIEAAKSKISNIPPSGKETLQQGREGLKSSNGNYYLNFISPESSLSQILTGSFPSNLDSARFDFKPRGWFCNKDCKEPDFNDCSAEKDGMDPITWHYEGYSSCNCECHTDLFFGYTYNYTKYNYDKKKPYCPRAIFEDPENDELRLAFADWLAGVPGQAARSEFIAVQVTLAGLAEANPLRLEYETRSDELLAQYRTEWLGPLADIEAVVIFERGFLSGLKIEAEIFLDRADQIFRYFPLRNLHVVAPTAKDIASLASLPHLPFLKLLSFSGKGLAHESILPLITSPNRRNLQIIILDLDQPEKLEPDTSQ